MPSAPVAPWPPHVLVADDDPASRRFLCDGLRSLGAQVQSCADGIQALQLARDQAFGLLLLDCRMPGAGAREVLAALRANGGASSDSLAVASSAELDMPRQRELLAFGFHHVLRKPCGIAELQRVLALLPGAVPVLDDEAALRASGDTSTMQALRQLLRHELTQLHQDLGAPEYDGTALDGRLHRLRSSCGFCGAPALAGEAAYLQQRLREDPRDSVPAIARFRDALAATLRALGD
ncbi:response regulator [Rhodanobacter sp. DHG33]|uniref:Hpt domain-containing response regulator n=1 Tax=Rhodanobacter sp. DHG33 TaxID=2775921 RepID=UPI0017808945|nr:response regulator [Rhodanobacter sp. DHG33]MBD8898347.1 response regulator [Rhodanobacter sp. DHG33]